MKILFCTSGLITGRGGIASYAHDFIEAFKAGNEFVVVTNDGYVRKDSDPFEVIRFDMNDFSLNNAKRFMAFISDMNPQLIVNSAFPLLSLVTPYISNGIKVISIAHFVDGKLLRAAGLNANYIDTPIVLSTFAKNNLCRQFRVKNKSKVKVVYNFMPAEEINIKRKKEVQVLKIVYPGGHSISKSADIVCMVLKMLLDSRFQFEFYWLGNITLPGSGWPFVKIKSVSDSVNKNDPRIKVFGPVPREEAKHIMANANIFLLPSRGEGCPITLLEAMRGACIPIISDAKHGSLDLIENNKSGIVVKQNNAKQIFNIITDIISQPLAYNHIYDGSYEKFRKDLQYDVWYSQMSQIIGERNNHIDRIPFNIWKYWKDALYIKYRDLLYFLKDRLLIQPYSMLIFRYIIYIKK